jgi:hypothetical protein
MICIQEHEQSCAQELWYTPLPLRANCPSDELNGGSTFCFLPYCSSTWRNRPKIVGDVLPLNQRSHHITE